MADQPQPQYAIGVDIGGTKCAAGLVRLDEGRVIARCELATRPERGGMAVLNDVIALTKSLQEEAQELAIVPASVGIGICELVSRDGRVLSEATVHWQDPLIHETLAAMSLPVQIDADVRAGARAEALYGAGRDSHSFVYVSVGTGISACLVFDSKPYAGARGLTGTFASSNGLIPGTDGQLHAGPPLEFLRPGQRWRRGLLKSAQISQGRRRKFCGLPQVGTPTPRISLPRRGRHWALPSPISLTFWTPKRL